MKTYWLELSHLLVSPTSGKCFFEVAYWMAVISYLMPYTMDNHNTLINLRHWLSVEAILPIVYLSAVGVKGLSAILFKLKLRKNWILEYHSFPTVGISLFSFLLLMFFVIDLPNYKTTTSLSILKKENIQKSKIRIF